MHRDYRNMNTKIEVMQESTPRPEMLLGTTYKIKTPNSEHAIYLTINDIILNEGTDKEERRPYEVFLNSKNIDNFQWVSALTRVMSAVFRKGGDVCFLIDELKSIFDPRGGYFKKGGTYMPSVVAELGWCLERHLVKLGMLVQDTLDDHQREYLKAKRKEWEDKMQDQTFPEQAFLCQKCNTKATILMDGCATCLNCGESKCG